jgi:hypothetical protein
METYQKPVWWSLRLAPIVGFVVFLLNPLRFTGIMQLVGAAIGIVLGALMGAAWSVLRKDKKTMIGKCHIQVDRAPSPDEVLWDNLILPFYKRMGGVLCNRGRILLMLATSGSIQYWFRELKHGHASGFPSASDSECFSLFDEFNDGTSPRDEVARQYIENFHRPTPLTECYCRSTLSSTSDYFGVLYSKFDVSEPSFEGGGPQEVQLCFRWTTAMVAREMCTMGIVFTILLTNAILSYFAVEGIKWEHQPDLTTEKIKATLTCFIAQFLNTAVIPAIVHMNLRAMEPEQVSEAGEVVGNAFEGSYTDMSAAWHHDVGALLVMVFCLNCILPHLYPILASCAYDCARCKDRHCSCDHQLTHHLTQHDLNELLMGPELPIEARHAELLNTVFSVFTYSGSMPILYWIAALNIFCQYIADHIGFLRFYRTPPMISAQLARSCSYYYPFALVIHACMTVWSLGDDAVRQETAVDVTAMDEVLYGDKTFNQMLAARAFGTSKSHYFWAIFGFVLVCYLVLRMVCIEQLEMIWNTIRGKDPTWEHNPDYYDVRTQTTLIATVLKIRY